MGINISVKRLGAQQDWFDSLRQPGDRDFGDHLNWGIDGSDGNRVAINGVRPADFAKARAWVEANIQHEQGRARLHEALNRMEADDALYFHVSY